MDKQQHNDEKAQVGIGTMIVFIATILVAAVAAGVLIDTSQKLQSKSTQTGNAATEMVGNALQIQAVYGKIDTDDIDTLEIWIELAAGSEPINLEELVIAYKTGSGTTHYEYDDNIMGGTAVTNEFVVRDDTETGTATGLGDRVLESGELHKLIIGLHGGVGNALNLAEGKDVQVDLIPEVGITVVAEFSTPDTYGSKTVFELF